MKIAIAAALAALAAGLLPGIARADEPLDLVGTWKGEATAVHLGANPYRPTEGASANFPDSVLEFTFVIAEQHGNRFTGTASAAGRSETLIGALAPDNRTGLILDNDGQYLMTVEDGSRINVCYGHSVEAARVVACYTLVRAE